ncbi:hypothetical protein ACQPXM_24525 [Kribbella sp. CA-253562]|uniref:hypothetical protein n=1 Tax=Kribbella sp. CA-253562 TaxID=3239942 RepID=UPI003D8B8861
MRAYRVVWLLFCGSIGALGVVVASTWSLATVVLLVVFAALTGGVAATVALEDTGSANPRPRHRRRIVTSSATLSALGSVAFVGLATLLGATMAVLLAALVVAGSPFVIRYCVRRLSGHGHLAGVPAPEQPNPGERSPRFEVTSFDDNELDHRPAAFLAPEHLSDEALCLAWRASFSALQRASTPEQKLRIVDQRCTHLDEIERRAARGLAAWLASGPRAAGDPSRFVLGEKAAGGGTIDWDALLHDLGK